MKVDHLKVYERENLEFQIHFSETNLHYLAGEPNSEHKTRCIKINEDGIAKCKARLKEMDGAKSESMAPYQFPRNTRCDRQTGGG